MIVVNYESIQVSTNTAENRKKKIAEKKLKWKIVTEFHLIEFDR